MSHSHIEINIDINNDHGGHNRNRDPFSQIARELRSMANQFDHHGHHGDQGFHHHHHHHHNDGFMITDHTYHQPQMGNPFPGQFDIPPLQFAPRAGDVPGIAPPVPQRSDNSQDPLAKYHLDSIPLPPCPPGFDGTKWNDPTHNTLKYDMGRDIQKFLSTGVKSEQEVEEFLKAHQSMIEKHGFKFLGAGGDTITISENGQTPYDVDAVFSVGGPESNAQWLTKPVGT